MSVVIPKLRAFFCHSIWALLVPLLVLWLGYVAYVSAGTMTKWRGYGSYYDLQAEGFRVGQLNMRLAPAPQLLAAEDPYDRANRRYWVLDLTYYKGKYYAYWGPFPAVLMALAKSLLRVQGVVGDQYLVIAALCVAAAAGGLILHRARDHLFPKAPRWLEGFAILAFGFTNPLLVAATAASVYLAAILWAQACLLTGLALALENVWRGRGAPGNSLRYWLAGLAWGFAVASRVTVVPAVAVLVCGLVLLVEQPTLAKGKDALRALAQMSAPLTAVGGLLLLYNWMRFDAWLEFGTSYQLSGYPLFRLSLRYVPLNLYAYLFQPLRWDCVFPFVHQVFHSDPPVGMEVPKDYMLLEPVAGWLRYGPLTWLIPVGLWLAPRSGEPARARGYLFCVGAFGTLALLPGLVALGLYLATMRYLGDVCYGLALLGAFSGLALAHHVASRCPRRPLLRHVSASVVAALCLWHAALGAAIGYGNGYTAHFKTHNPALYAKLTRWSAGISAACERW